MHPNGKCVYLKHQLPDGSGGNGLSAYRYLRVGHHNANTIETYLFNRDDASLTLVDTANVPAGIGSGSVATSSHTQ